MNRRTFKIDIDFDVQFWALLPAININLHNHGFYFGKQKYEIGEIK